MILPCEGFGSVGFGPSGFGTEGVFLGSAVGASPVSLLLLDVSTDIDSVDALHPDAWAVSSGNRVIAIQVVTMLAPLSYRLTLSEPATSESIGAVNLSCESFFSFSWPGSGPHIENACSFNGVVHAPYYEQIQRQRFVCFDAVDDEGFRNIVVTAVFSTGRQEAVYNLAAGFTPEYIGSGAKSLEGGKRITFSVRPKTGWLDATFALRVTLTDSTGNVDTGTVL